MKTLRYDSLIIGAGLAGLSYALTAARLGLKVCILEGPGDSEKSSSWMAQGGIVYEGSEGENEFLSDLNLASGGSYYPDAAKIIFNEGKAAIDELLINQAKVDFDRDERGNLLFVREAAHSKDRIIFSHDHTGRSIMKKMAQLVLETEGIDFKKNLSAIDLMTLSHNSINSEHRYRPLTCIGCYAIDHTNDEVMAIVASNTILATGGIGQLFSHTTNGPHAFGDGLAMAYRVGARIMDLEYIQFHPTVFIHPSFPPMLISEALRGEGAYLVNAFDQKFMDELHPLGSLAPRDTVARSIALELHRSGHPSVFLDARHLGKDFLAHRFPTIYQACLDRGIDMSKDLIPVVPAAHYLCGGIHTDLRGRTNIIGLRAIGEVACTGLHGANRLASTSLLECLTMGRRTAEFDATDTELREKNWEVKEWRSEKGLVDETLIQQDLELIKKTMWNYVGLIRTPKRLERAERIINELAFEIREFYANGELGTDLLHLRNAVEVARLIIHAASKNKKSKGCHFIDSTPSELSSNIQSVEA